MNITRCLHAALLVSDKSRAEVFYDVVLGLPKVERPFNYAGTWYQIGEIQFHLIEDSSFAAQLHNPEKIGRNPHVAFGVEDLSAVRSQLDSQNHPYQMSASGRQALFVQDPDGNVIEISQDEANSN
ncbi:VOC family protein [[Leptolyngbya] sp. PCC 7376]|uniref:VOC family protein n=1 Tax=[Leptolyngbya] sp. PCC 7376 TaxID=111781 RepID=UPI0005A20888|nr:VOC family protein [[Leptolyngbya] sp. PCC 7376]